MAHTILCSMDTYWSRLKPEMDANGLSIPRLAERMGVSFQAVAKVRDGGAFGSENNIKAAKLFGLTPEWLATGRGKKFAADGQRASTHAGAAEPKATYLGGVARAVSHTPFNLPVTLTWEQVMQSQELPERFIVESPDDALSPRLPRGTAVVFERASTAQPGECVLVRDKRGATHMRRYVQGIGRAFTAQALNDAYASLESERDGLVVLAVMAWRAERRI